MALRGGANGVRVHRFFVSPSACREGKVVFDRDQTHQIRNVLRLRRGDSVIVLDGTGRESEVRLDTLNGSRAEGVIERTMLSAAEPAVRLTIYQGLLKGSKLELVLQKCTEIGVTGFVPTVTARSVPAEPIGGRRRRHETIVREAAEQSRRGIVPHVGAPSSYDDALQHAVRRGQVVLLWEGESEVRLQSRELETGAEVGLFVGPEGGFTDEEVADARHLGATVVTLGRRILRSETAAIVGAALILARLGDVG